jgi:argininosuccinate lyase
MDDRRHTLTGRLSADPHDLLRTEILAPQLTTELATLLPWYLRLEKVLLLEYRRMALLDAGEAARIAVALDRVDPDELAAGARANLTDVVLTIEAYVRDRVPDLPPAWHVDRSRNDLQASAQMLFGRDRVLDIADELLAFARAAVRLAGPHVDVPMPGYTHLQAAQVISPAFYLSAVAEQMLQALRRFDAVYRTASTCPLGAGAMAGQELPWDRERMARLLGCETVSRHALVAVASRDWALAAAAELSLVGVTLSRFGTDLMTWSSEAYGFVELPDDWSGISAAMPQKKNYPVLERIRGRTAHLLAGYVDVATGHRNTPYSNGIEVSKEAGAQLPALFGTAVSTLRLFRAVLDRLAFHPDRMRSACDGSYLAGFTLANLLTLREGVAWRTAQVIAGRYIVAATARGSGPSEPDPGLLDDIARGEGYLLGAGPAVLAEALSTGATLAVKRTPGSTHPRAVRQLLAEQSVELDGWQERLDGYRQRIHAGLAGLDGEIAGLVRHVPVEVS